MSIHDRIKEVRERYDLTQKKFGENIGLSRPQVTLLETGKRYPSDRTISDICRVYGVSRNWLLHGEGEIFEEREAFIQFLVNTLTEVDDKEREFLMNYFKLPEKKRKVFMEFLDKLLEKEE